MFPASIGLSFCVQGDETSLWVEARWGRYERARSEQPAAEGKEPPMVWRRSQAGGRVQLPLVEGHLAPLSPDPGQPAVWIEGLVRRRGGAWVISLFLVNKQDEPEKERDRAWVFQPELAVEGDGGRGVFLRRVPLPEGSRLDPVAHAEALTMAMLYRQTVEFASGHGVAVQATLVEGETSRAAALRTIVVPEYEVPQQVPPRVEDEPLLAGLQLDMKELATAAPEMLIASLTPLPRAYRQWIEARREELTGPAYEPFVSAGEDALRRCERALERIEEGLELLRRSEPARAAFQFSNRAMWQQRVRSLYSERRRRGAQVAIEEVDVPANRSWRTFQLAFQLINLPGLSDLGHPDRTAGPEAAADLLWFPTGGGKTEAYLGLTAYVLAMRRLQGVVEGRSGGEGVAVLMRYTLRLLTLQQFQRAAALICACERIRQEARAGGDRRWGDEPFRLGLWVGAGNTPNHTEDAAEALHNARGQGYGGGASPAQLTSCPWCGVTIDPGVNIQVESYKMGAGRTLTYCGDPLGLCPFSKAKSSGEGIPVVVVDEEIYRLLPAMIVATVDKFAQMPWNSVLQMLFGQVEGRCSRHGFRSPELEDADTHPANSRAGLPSARTTKQGPLRPPDLILQDELHLISGPLGTLTGLYETVVDELCSWKVGEKTVRPKIVASTATIRRAAEQMHALFLRRVEVFPPHGIAVEDSFFARQQDTETLPGRRYLGICAPGKRLKAALIRVYVAFLAASQMLYEKYGKAVDPWMTTVGYFNSLRELAGMRRLVGDDVSSRLRDMDRRGLARRNRPLLEELTSRKKSTDIPKLLDQMEVGFDPIADARREEQKKSRVKKEGRAWKDDPRPLDVLLATNMISVGVDVKRLGQMIVCGQPKTTAEYIQATSRVGRSHPGVVCTVYNWARPRDLSHYEGFCHYHATFYQHVEALSLTPFAPRALDRGLSALLVALVRLSSGQYSQNAGAQAIRPELAIVARVVAAVKRRALLVTGSPQVEQQVAEMIQHRLDEWVSRAQQTQHGVRLGYRSARDGSTRGLLKTPEEGPWELFTCPNSLRDVEPTVPLLLDDSGNDGTQAQTAGEVW
jgi:hypothetical protein